MHLKVFAGISRIVGIAGMVYNYLQGQYLIGFGMLVILAIYAEIMDTRFEIHELRKEIGKAPD